MNNKQTFSKFFYDIEIIEQAIRDYKNIAKITIQDNGNEFECSFESKEAPVEMVIREFDNYLIELLNGT
jgi:hypothetical protein